MSLYPNVIVPLQIDLAIELGRYLFSRSANPCVREPGCCDALGSCGTDDGFACHLRPWIAC
jgi:hypothetical protein